MQLKLTEIIESLEFRISEMKLVMKLYAHKSGTCLTHQPDKIEPYHF